MAAERMPAAEPSLLAGPMAWLTRGVLRYPVAVIAVAITLALVALTFTGSELEFHTSRLDLLDAQCSHNRLWIDYINKFGHQDDVVVVVQGGSRRQVVPVLEELSSDLISQSQFFHAVLHEVNLSRIRSKGLYYLKPDQLRPIEPFLDEIKPIVDGQWSRLKLSDMIDELCLQLHNPKLFHRREPTLAMMDRLSYGLLAALTQPVGYCSPWPEMPEVFASLREPGSAYFLTNEGRWGLILLRLAEDEDKNAFAPGGEALDTLRRLTKQAEARHPGVQIGLTGLPVLENDEMRSSQTAMIRASFLSLLGVACLFVAGFGGVRHPMMAMLALVLAMAWSFGYITLVVGHLNILTIAFAVVLIGLGIDFGVHFTARYLQNRREHLGSGEAIVETATGVGPGIVTGAVTTAIAFFMAGFTTFTGVAELGIIAGGGILLCCVAALVVLPAMISLSDSHRPRAVLPMPLNVHTWIRPFLRWPRFVLLLTTAGTILVGLGVARLRYDHNLLNLQEEGLESVELEKALLNKADKSAWFALSIAKNREELTARRKAFLEKQSIDRIEDISSYLPLDYEQRRPIIERIRHRLDDLPERPPEIPVDPPGELGQALARAQVLINDSADAPRIQHRLEQARIALRGLTQPECYERLRRFQHGMAGDLLSRLFQLRSVADPEPPKLDDLPKSLVTRLVGQEHNHHFYLMKIYSKSDIWNMEMMRQFVREVRSVDPKATGNPLQTYEASRQMKASYENAALYALGAIAVVLLFDFGSLRYVLLAILPLGAGMLQLFGMLGLLDIPLNPANMIVLPLILGIGVDDGVHVVHDFRRQRGPYRMSPSTASAVLITSLTTIIGFGSLMIASHRGLQSLGRVLTIGVSCCLFASLVMLPALLTWATRHRPSDLGTTPDQSQHRSAIGRSLHRYASGAHPSTSPPTVPQIARRDSGDTPLRPLNGPRDREPHG
ncbi:MAG: MMPL family transporter [Pirellulales bacterium]|nr:MMPL family transporter [Pirellulales bacterium]